MNLTNNISFERAEILETTMVKILKVGCWGYRREILMGIESVKQQYYKACTGIIYKKLYELI